jgi:predicted ferric reductase
MMGLHPGALVALYAACAVAPLALAALSAPRENDFLAELGIGLGLMAYAMLLAQFISSGRFAALSGRVGIDRTMRFHQLSARVLAVFVLLHPLVPRIPTEAAMLPMAAQMLSIMFTAPHLRSGVLAWGLLLLGVVIAIWRHRLPLNYEAWRALHVVGAIAIAAAGAHHMFTVGSYSATPPLFWFWCALLAIAFASFVFVYWVRPLLLWRMGYHVTGNREVAPGVHELAFEPTKGRGLRFHAGQFAWLNLKPVPLFDHPFSLCSSPTEAPRVRMLIRSRGDFTGRLQHIPIGTPVRLDGPHGHFTLTGQDVPSLCFIAGGIGISPIMSMLRDLYAHQDARPVTILYAARDTQHLVFAEEIEAMAADRGWRVHLFVDTPTAGGRGQSGAITAASLHAALGVSGARDTLCMLCGPTPMMLELEQMLLRLGVPANRIIYERFEYD